MIQKDIETKIINFIEDFGCITEEQLMLLINYLQESTTPLSESYFNMIEMIETGRYPNAVS